MRPSGFLLATLALMAAGLGANVIASVLDPRPERPAAGVPFTAAGEVTFGDLAFEGSDVAVLALGEEGVWARAVGLAPRVRVEWRGAGDHARLFRLHLENVNLVASVVSLSAGTTVVARSGATLEVERSLRDGPLEVSATITDEALADGKFALVGCTRSNRLLVPLLEALACEKPIFAIHLGDLSHGLSYEMEAFRAAFDAIGLPVFVCPGNHDVCQWRRGTGSLASLHDVFGPTPTSFRVADRRFVLFNLAEYPIGDGQVAWLDKTVRASDDPLSVFFHRSPVDTTGRGRALPEDVSGPIAAIASGGPVSAVYCSHLHGFMRTTFGGRPCVMSSGGGEEGTELYHHMLVRLDGAGDQVITYDRPRAPSTMASRGRIEVPVLGRHPYVGAVVAACVAVLLALRSRRGRRARP